MKRIGILIDLQLLDNEDSQWDDEAYAVAWLAAAGGKFKRIFRWIDDVENGAIYLDLESPSTSRIRSILVAKERASSSRVEE